MIGACIGLCPGGFAQHVIAIGESLGLHSSGTFHRLADIFAQDELAAHFTHRTGDSGTNYGFAQSLYRAAKVAGDTGLFVVQHATR